MSDFITLTCPSCGGKLKVTDQIHLLACRNCGNEHMVVRDSGSIYLAPLAQDVRGIRVGVDKTAAELAVARLGKEIKDLEVEFNTTMTQSDDQWVGPPDAIKVWVWVGGIALILSLINSANESGGWGIFFFLVMVTAIGYAAKLQRDRSIEIKALREKKVERINSELSIRYEQYRKNRRIAES